MQVKIKKLSPEAVTPTYAKHGDAGLDLTATSKFYDDHGCVCYGTSLAFEIPNGYVGLLFPRSSNAKKDLILSNSIGVIDSGYRGEVVFKFKPSCAYSQISEGVSLRREYPDSYSVGERIGQIIILPYPKIEFVEVDELSDSDRGNGGFGSTDAITKSIEDNFNV